VSRRLTVALLIFVAVVGFAIRAISNNFTVGAIGYFIVGVALVFAIAYVFYEIGAGEDRERSEDDEQHR
jgi:hypothetical protein